MEVTTITRLVITLLVITLVSVVSVTSRPERRKEAREWRAVVPQLLPNYTTTPLPPPQQGLARLQRRLRPGPAAVCECLQ